MDFQSLEAFVKIAESRSLSAAARLYDLPKSTISLRLRQLEEQIGAELFTRQGKSLELTDAGRVLLERARHILALCDDARTAVSSVQEDAAGVIKIGATGEFGTALNAQMLSAFRQTYPKIQLDLVFFSPSMFLDLSRQRTFDAVLSFNEDGRADRHAEVLTTVTHGLYASPHYLDAFGTPADTAALSAHRGVLYRTPDGIQSWKLKRKNRSVEVLPPGDIVANDYWTLKYFAVARAGIALLPQFFTELECQHNHLVPVLPEWRTEPRPICIRVPDQRYVAPKTRAFIDFCKTYFQPGFAFAGPRYYVEALQVPAGISSKLSQDVTD
ncbi:LysR family transcriptional regulator [Roseibium aggregatum]|uniref:LysR family transcriptional regulator n=1 Tax=Roseibium aggregatum TaxID=187304 RepID=A0A939IZ38_9HYPH|nr:LysR family transcriptional regulator [Roseibium aggregatum]MBN9669641.1 LysR family transcriptional regulator [Roseibium aggregatum]